MNYIEGNVLIKDGSLLDKKKFIYIADGLLIEFGRLVNNGEIWIRGQAFPKEVCFFGKCPDCNLSIKRKEITQIIKPFEFKENPGFDRPLRIVYHGSVISSEIRQRDLEVLTVRETNMDFKNYIYDPEQIEKDYFFLSEGTDVAVSGLLKQKKRKAYAKCGCGKVSPVNEQIPIVEPETIKINVLSMYEEAMKW